MNSYLVECFIQGYAGQEIVQVTSPSNAVIVYLCHRAVSKLNISQVRASDCNIRVTKLNGIRHIKRYYYVNLWK